MLVDLVVLTVMISASGGLSSSLNSLLITAVAASSILLPLSSALLSAALGFFLLIGILAGRRSGKRRSGAGGWNGPEGWDGFWAQLNNATDDLVRLGVLGAVLFIAAGLTYALAERARRGEALARRRTWELLEVAELNQGIIRHLQNGVVVVDALGQVQLMNDTAREWLGASANRARKLRWSSCRRRWRGGLEGLAARWRSGGTQPSVRPNIARS